MEALIQEAYENDFNYVVLKVSLEGDTNARFFYNELEAENYYMGLSAEDYPSQILLEVKKYYMRDVCPFGDSEKE